MKWLEFVRLTEDEDGIELTLKDDEDKLYYVGSRELAKMVDEFLAKYFWSKSSEAVRMIGRNIFQDKDSGGG